MRDGHARFAFLNRTGDRAVAILLHSPLHPIVSRQLTLITVTGRCGGRQYTFPVGYRHAGERVTIPQPVGRSWRNLRSGAPIRLWLRGAQRSGQATVRGDERSGVIVDVELDPRP
jgi:hypothetical protein